MTYRLELTDDDAERLHSILMHAPGAHGDLVDTVASAKVPEGESATVERVATLIEQVIPKNYLTTMLSERIQDELYKEAAQEIVGLLPLEEQS